MMFPSKGTKFFILIILSALILVDCQRNNRGQSGRINRFKKATEPSSTSTPPTSPKTLNVTSEKSGDIESIESDLTSTNASSITSSNGNGNSSESKGWNAKLGFCREIVSQYGNDIRSVLLVGNFAFPTSREAIDAHCALGDRVYKALRKFSTSCLTSLPRQLFSIFLRGLRKLIKNVCHASKEKERAIEILKCTTDASLPGWNVCLNVANRQFESTAINSTDAQLFGDLCCMYNQLENCVRANLQKRPECASKPFEVSKFFQQMIDATLKDVMDIACTKYATEGECIKNNADGLIRLKGAADANFEVNDIFLIGPLLKIFPRLAND